MPGQRLHNQPTQDGILPLKGPKSKVVSPPNPRPETRKGLVSILANPIPLTQEDSGRDKDLKTLLKSLQPKNFSGKGDNVSNILKEWIIKMENYFVLAKYNTVAQGIMGKAKIFGSAKLLWKLNCQLWGVDEATQHLEELKAKLKEQYYPLNYETLKMNEFLSCSQKGRTIELYYEEFVKLSRYAPLMTKE